MSVNYERRWDHGGLLLAQILERPITLYYITAYDEVLSACVV